MRSGNSRFLAHQFHTKFHGFFFFFSFNQGPDLGSVDLPLKDLNVFKAQLLFSPQFLCSSSALMLSGFQTQLLSEYYLFSAFCCIFPKHQSSLAKPSPIFLALPVFLLCLRHFTHHTRQRIPFCRSVIPVFHHSHTLLCQRLSVLCLPPLMGSSLAAGQPCDPATNSIPVWALLGPSYHQLLQIEFPDAETEICIQELY